jgi:threonine/homoserine/homoserine lactone efflux protein
VFLTTLLNPKVFVFALVIIPLQAPNVMTYLAGFSLTVMLIGGTWVCFGSLAGAATGRYAAARLVPRTAAIVLVGFAALIASPFIH